MKLTPKQVEFLKAKIMGLIEQVCDEEGVKVSRIQTTLFMPLEQLPDEAEMTYSDKTGEPWFASYGSPGVRHDLSILSNEG